MLINFSGRSATAALIRVSAMQAFTVGIPQSHAWSVKNSVLIPHCTLSFTEYGNTHILLGYTYIKIFQGPYQMCNIYSVYIEYRIPSTGYLAAKGWPLFVVDINNYSISEDDSMSLTLLLHGAPKCIHNTENMGLDIVHRPL